MMNNSLAGMIHAFWVTLKSDSADSPAWIDPSNPQKLKSSMKFINLKNGQWQLEMFQKEETLLQISWMYAYLTL